VTEQIQRDDAVSARGKRPCQRLMHATIQQQSVQQNGRPLTTTEFVVTEAMAEMRECRHGKAG
jgi:hypothetical protein